MSFLATAAVGSSRRQASEPSSRPFSRLLRSGQLVRMPRGPLGSSSTSEYPHAFLSQLPILPLLAPVTSSSVKSTPVSFLQPPEMASTCLTTSPGRLGSWPGPILPVSSAAVAWMDLIHPGHRGNQPPDPEPLCTWEPRPSGRFSCLPGPHAPPGPHDHPKATCPPQGPIGGERRCLPAPPHPMASR